MYSTCSEWIQRTFTAKQTEGSNIESNNEEMNENPSWMVRKCLVLDTHFALTMPVSTTYLSPGMVTEDSAMLVESTTLRQPWGGHTPDI